MKCYTFILKLKINLFLEFKSFISVLLCYGLTLKKENCKHKASSCFYSSANTVRSTINVSLLFVSSLLFLYKIFFESSYADFSVRFCNVLASNILEAFIGSFMFSKFDFSSFFIFYLQHLKIRLI